MKTKRIILILAIIAIPVILHAQKQDFSDMTLNGLSLTEKYTKEEIFAVLGVPDKEDQVIHRYFVYYRDTVTYVNPNNPSDEPITYIITDEIGYDYYEDTGECMISVFTISSDLIAFNDYIRIGDPISKVYEMGGTTLFSEYGRNKYRIHWAPDGVPVDHKYMDWNMYPYFVYGDDGIITSIDLYYD